MQRLKAINQHIPVELGVVERKGELLQKWLDAVMAYAMEQRVFEILGCGANRM